MLPLGVSAVTLGFGFLITLDEPPLDLRDSPLLVPIAQALVALPLVVRMLVPVLASVDPDGVRAPGTITPTSVIPMRASAFTIASICMDGAMFISPRMFRMASTMRPRSRTIAGSSVVVWCVAGRSTARRSIRIWPRPRH